MQAASSESAAAAAPPVACPFSDDWYAHHFDHVSPDLAQNLHETLATMRDRHPVAYSEEHGGFWVVTGYEDVLRVGAGLAHLQLGPRRVGARDQDGRQGHPRASRPPAAPRVQAPHQRLLHPRGRGRLRGSRPGRSSPGSSTSSSSRAGATSWPTSPGRSPVSPSSSWCSTRRPTTSPRSTRWRRVPRCRPTPTAAGPGRRCTRGSPSFVEARRHQPPRGDVVDAVLAAEIEGRPITEDEIIGVIQLLILGGLETTAGALGQFMIRFCREPEIPALLRAHPELIPDAVEELLRLEPPFIAIARTATSDTEIGGQRDPRRRQGADLLGVGQPRRGRVRLPRRLRPRPARATGTWRSAPGRTAARAPTWPA